MKLPNPFKPWYLYRPSQLARRLWRAAFPPDDPIQVVRLPWGCLIEIDTRETIGRSIWKAGVYELPIAEVLYRLADPNALAIDGGANIGAMTGLLATCSAEVWAFEPHPFLVERLRRNVAQFAQLPGFSTCRVFDSALSDRTGQARLHLPAIFATNQGSARIDNQGEIVVRTVALDEILADREVGVLKLDVEGHELAVLQGATKALQAGRIRHIVFEDHLQAASPVLELLRTAGYTLFRICWRLHGVRLASPDQPGKADETPNFLASRTPDVVEKILQKPRGWLCLRHRRSSR